MGRPLPDGGGVTGQLALTGGPKRRTGMKPGGQLARRSRIRSRSPRTARVYQQERRPLVARLLAERPWCEIRWDRGCQGQSADVHEPRMRSRGADICDPAGCVTACRHCHDQVHANPAAATEKGLMVPSGRPRKAVPR